MMPRRVVVVGYGMAGARFADEIRRREPNGRLAVTMIGAERHYAYNRVLLSNVIAGSLNIGDVLMHSHDWAHRSRVDLRLGVSATSVDTMARRVVLSDRSTVDYDELVLATGSRPLVPPVEGLCAGDRVIAFRGLDDCTRILSAATPARRVAVLGGGLLGLEAARGLAGRGIPVTVVHPVGHVMERQLDPLAGATLARVVGALGVEVRTGRNAVEHLPGWGLVLDDGSTVSADLVVVCAGTRAETALAEAAGLTVDGGVVVDDQMRTSVAGVYAIGDCAAHPAAVAGHVAPAWDQAAVLADLLSGADPVARYRGNPVVTRLKARDIELVTMGEAHTEPDSAGAEVVRLEDPVRGRYAKLVLRNGRVTGAIMLGFPDAAAVITQLHQRGIPAPSDRIALLLGRAMPPPTELPEPAMICQCNTVDRGRLVDAWNSGARTVEDLIGVTRASTSCGSCLEKLFDLARSLGQQEPAVSET